MTRDALSPSIPSGPAAVGSQFLDVNAFGSKTPLVVALVEGLSRLTSDNWARLARFSYLGGAVEVGPLLAATQKASSMEDVFRIQATRWVEQEVEGLLSRQPDKIFRVWDPKRQAETPADGLRAWVTAVIGQAAAALTVLDHMDPEGFGEFYAPLAPYLPFEDLVARGQELQRARR